MEMEDATSSPARASPGRDILNIMAVGDMHIKAQSVHLLRNAMDSMVEVVVAEKPDYVVFLGDQLDGHKHINLSCLYILNSLIEKIAKISRVLMLVGNHDMVNNSQFCSEEHAFSSMKYIPNLTVIDKPTLVNLEGFANGEPGIVCTPFIPKGRYTEAQDSYLPPELENWKGMKGDVVFFSHQEFRSATMMQVVSTDGDVYDATWPMVVSGHIHERQSIGDNILYIGTPWVTNFTKDVSKTISLLEVGRGSHFKERRVVLNNLPTRKVVTCTSLKEVEELKLDPCTLYKLKIRGDCAMLNDAKIYVRRIGNIDRVWRTVVVTYETTGAVSRKVTKETYYDANDESLDRVRIKYVGKTMKRVNDLIDAHENGPKLKKALIEHMENTSHSD